MDESSLTQSILTTTWLYAYWVLYGVTNVACAYFVYQDAIKQNRCALNIGPYWWAAFSLAGGIWSLFAYWLMEHSSLSKSRD